MQTGIDSGSIIVGLSARVQNDDPTSIGALWDAFRSQNLKSKIGSDSSPEIYCVYHDYDGGFMDPYRMTIGHRVHSITECPHDLYQVVIPQQKMISYKVEGTLPQALIAQWQTIWGSDLNRSFVADYDVYDADNPKLVTVHVGIAET